MNETSHKIKFFGHGISHFQNIEIKGKLIVIEGPDSSGRSDTNRIIESAS